MNDPPRTWGRRSWISSYPYRDGSSRASLRFFWRHCTGQQAPARFDAAPKMAMSRWNFDQPSTAGPPRPRERAARLSFPQIGSIAYRDRKQSVPTSEGGNTHVTISAITHGPKIALTVLRHISRNTSRRRTGRTCQYGANTFFIAVFGRLDAVCFHRNPFRPGAFNDRA